MLRVTLVQLNRGAEEQGRYASDEVTSGVSVAGSGSIGNTWASRTTGWEYGGPGRIEERRGG